MYFDKTYDIMDAKHPNQSMQRKHGGNIMTKNAKRIASLLLCVILLLSLIACTDGDEVHVIRGPQGEKGQDGVTPTIEISEDGYWVINGEKSTMRAQGEDGSQGPQGENGADGQTPTITISEDGYWVINGEKTDTKAQGESGHSPVITIQNGYWYIDGVNTNQLATIQTVDTPNTALNTKGLWESGAISGQTGKKYATNAALRTKEYLSKDVKLIYAQGDYYFYVYLYDQDGTYVGTWNQKEITNSLQRLFYLNASEFSQYNLRISLHRYGATPMEPDEYSNISFVDTSSLRNYKTPTLTFIDDDGSLEALNNWESICDEIGIDITSALVTATVGRSNKVSWDDVARLQNKGFEFVSHTHNHVKLTTASTEKIIEEFESSITALREHGCESRYLVYPYNATNDDVMSLVKKYFSAGIGLGNSQDNTLPLNTYHLRRCSINDTSVKIDKEYNGQTVSVYEFRTLETLKSYVDDAITNGGWLIIMTHLRNDSQFYYDEETREMIIELCKYAAERGVNIETFGNAFEEHQNVLEQGSISDSSFYFVDCNGIVHYRKPD